MTVDKDINEPLTYQDDIPVIQLARQAGSLLEILAVGVTLNSKIKVDVLLHGKTSSSSDIVADGDNTGDDGDAISGTYISKSDVIWIAEVTTGSSVSSSITEDSSNTSPDEATISGTYNAVVDADWDLVITAPGGYGTFEATVYKAGFRDVGNKIHGPWFPESGTSRGIADGISVIFTGVSSMTDGDFWVISNKAAYSQGIITVKESDGSLVKTYTPTSAVAELIASGVSLTITDGGDNILTVGNKWTITNEAGDIKPVQVDSQGRLVLAP